MTADKYDEGLTKQCINFFEKNKDFFDKHKMRLSQEKIDSSTLYNLGDKHEISDDFYFSTISSLSITMEEKTLENDDISSLGFQIDDPIVINKKICINNFLLTRTYESIDNSVRLKNQYQKLGFKELSTDKYLEIMENKSFEYYKNYTQHQWFIYEGDLRITTEEFNKLDRDSSFIITGNLIVDGVISLKYHMLFVLKNVKAKSIFIDSSTCYIAQTAYFDDVLIMDMGDGQPIIIHDTEGKFIFSRLDSVEINVSKEKVDVFVDYAYGKSFGSIENLLEDKFLEVDEDGDIDIDFDMLCDAILDNDSIFKN